jgi:hypothetical protein
MDMRRRKPRKPRMNQKKEPHFGHAMALGTQTRRGRERDQDLIACP